MLIVQDKPKSVSAEAYRTLRTNITFSSLDERIRSIMVTSAYPGDGKTTLISNLALSFAESGQRVIVVDCDMRKPNVHRKFEVSNRIGISEIMLGEAEIKEAIKVHSPNVHILNCGKIPPNPLEVISSNSMRKLIDELTLRYDYVFIDAPPILPVADAKVLSTIADGVILVASCGESEKSGVLKAYEEIKSVKARVIGTVANKMKKRDAVNKGYYAYYGKEAETTM